MQQEQDSNFITRLHAGKLDIIPWPVIDSRDFYKLFAALKKRLDLQKTSHPSAGGFLHTIKTLMAKLKVRSVSLLVNSKVNDVYLQTNDWGALSSPSLHLYREILFTFTTDTMAEHRAKLLSALLSFALATGYAEIEPDFEPLKVSTGDRNRGRNI